jgi:hypothetical protein
MSNYEEAFVKGFVEVNRQERFLGFLGDAKKRRKLIAEFDRLKSGFLDRECMIPLRGAGSLPPNVFAALRKMGAPETCWPMGGRFDRQEKELLQALRESGDGFVLSCIPGRLAYIKTEDEEFILRR